MSPLNRPDKYVLAILATTLTWGTFWIPLRQLDKSTQGGALYIGLAMTLPLLLLLPRLITRRKVILSAGLPLWILGLTFGIAGSFYAEGMLRGNVARVILLFYLTPVWSTLFARLFLNEPITRRRMLTLVLGLVGMYVVLGADNTFPLPDNVAEWLGLIAGAVWGIAMVCAQKTQSVHPLDSTAVIFIFLPLTFMALSLLPNGHTWAINANGIQGSTIFWMLALAFLWYFPSVILTMIGAVKIEPGKVAILLMLEVIIGISSAALLTDEPFGLRELAGAILIIGAGIVEFTPSNYYKKTA